MGPVDVWWVLMVFALATWIHWPILICHIPDARSCGASEVAERLRGSEVKLWATTRQDTSCIQLSSWFCRISHISHHSNTSSARLGRISARKMAMDHGKMPQLENLSQRRQRMTLPELERALPKHWKPIEASHLWGSTPCGLLGWFGWFQRCLLWISLDPTWNDVNWPPIWGKELKLKPPISDCDEDGSNYQPYASTNGPLQ